ncbi:hypothetical protein Agub_g7889, partial [Astrephomene gubernaculifera]
ERCGEAAMSVQEEIMEVLRVSWPVHLGFLVSVTTLYLVFPFFTYVPAAGAGWLGSNLPLALFYTRLFTDLAGRLLPRIRSLQLRSASSVLSLAAASLALAALFFAYILASRPLAPPPPSSFPATAAAAAAAIPTAATTTTTTAVHHSRVLWSLLHNDAVPLVLVVALWLLGGFTNTAANTLAPLLVPPELAGRASALMALGFNAGHIGGLLAAAALAAAA